MGTVSNIQYVDSAANPTSGCDGCELWVPPREIFDCYSGKRTTNLNGINAGFSPEFEMVIPRPGRMRVAALWPDLFGKRRADPEHPKPWLDHLPRVIFISDMADALSKAITFEFLEEEVTDNVISHSGKKHIWIWLTKQPKRMGLFAHWSQRRGRPWPPNLWAGTSVTSQATVGRIADLLAIGDESTRRFVSLEPQHGLVDLGQYLPRIDWLIHGGQSAPEIADRDSTPPFHIDWARELKRACSDAGCAYFLKQVGAHVVDDGKRLALKDASHGGAQDEWPADLAAADFRQMPRAKMLAHRVGTGSRSTKILPTSGISAAKAEVLT